MIDGTRVTRRCDEKSQLTGNQQPSIHPIHLSVQSTCLLFLLYSIVAVGCSLQLSVGSFLVLRVVSSSIHYHHRYTNTFDQAITLLPRTEGRNERNEGTDDGRDGGDDDDGDGDEETNKM